jgi:hypothetical protein
LAQSVDSAVHIVLGLHREGLLEEAAAEARRLGRERSFRDLASLVRVLSDSGADGYVANVLEAPAQRRVVEVVELARCLRGANAYRFVKVLTRQFAKTRSPAELAELAVLLRRQWSVR